MTTATATVQLTPAMLAEAFWKLYSDEQAEFFTELAKLIEGEHAAGNTHVYALGEMQWHYVGSELERPENKKAREMLMTMAAPLYMHTLMATGGW